MSDIRKENESLIARESQLNLDITNEILLEKPLDKAEYLKQEYTPNLLLSFIPLLFAFQMIAMYPEMHNKILKYIQWTFIGLSTLYIFRPSIKYEKIYSRYFFIMESVSLLVILFYNHMHYFGGSIELCVIISYYLVYSFYRRKGQHNEIDANTNKFTEDKSNT